MNIKIEKEKPKFKVSKISYNLNSLVEHMISWNNYILEIYNYKKKMNIILKSKNDKNWLSKIKTELSLTLSTDIHPALFSFISHYHSNSKIIVNNKKWKDSVIVFLKQVLQKLSKKNNLEPYVSQFKIPGYDGEITVAFIPIMNNINYDIKEYIDNLFSKMGVIENEKLQKLSKKIISKQNSSTRSVKYIVQEILANIQEHANLKFNDKELSLANLNIYSDFDYFYLTVSDPGITIPQNVKDFLKKDNFDNINLCKWAFTEFHTTKTNSNGGKGLNDIIFLLKKLKGQMWVMSNNVVMEFNYKNKDIFDKVNYNLNGTIFMIQIPQESFKKEFIFDKIENKKIRSVFDD